MCDKCKKKIKTQNLQSAHELHSANRVHDDTPSNKEVEIEACFFLDLV